MRRALRSLPLTLAFVGLVPAIAAAQSLVGRSDSVYTWRGALPARGLFTVRNFNGPIDVRPSSGNTAELRAVKRTSRGGRVTDVAFELRTSSNGDVSICSVRADRDSCDGDRRRSNDDDDRWNNRDVSVAMTVLLPRGTQLKVATGNGALTMERVGGDVHASTGNGRVRVDGTEGTVNVSTGNGDVEVRSARSSVRVSTGNGDVDVATSEGPVSVSTGNGDIDVRMSALRARDDMSFSTGSGSVRLSLPASYNGELDATTGNGSMRSDFDLKLRGEISARRIRATIGGGGPTLRMSTGNGTFELRKS